MYNNIDDLNDPYYLGYKTGRLDGLAYERFIDKFVTAIQKKFPGILIQWEDFSRQNAFTILDKYRYKLLSFNDDIQGTGSVALAGILNSLRKTNEDFKQQQFLIYGAGAGGIGIARRIAACLQSRYNLSESAALAHIVVIDSKGLITKDRSVALYKQRFAIPKTKYYNCV